ncbi:VOC family protein [Paenibacillus sp. BC26]|uniref:VOC family protein n=1 Tax=Paenibacillus sp. BC26 TaxID=1881032 RepID=UPI0008EC3459|nr:VOC family protein [Paenibacillus sp. BC26]SFT24781.1 PhnB protein [Paenibacillus sp. BC26]
MTKLRPYLYCEDAKDQANFYMEALGGEIISQQTYGEMMPGAAEDDKDRVIHLVLQAAGLLFYMADAGPIQRGNGIDLTLEFETEEEAEVAFNNLSGNGGTVIMPFERMFWGSMFGRIEDKYGVRWQIATQPGH